jgi:hypothetical protein
MEPARVNNETREKEISTVIISPNPIVKLDSQQQLTNPAFLFMQTMPPSQRQLLQQYLGGSDQWPPSQRDQFSQFARLDESTLKNSGVDRVWLDQFIIPAMKMSSNLLRTGDKDITQHGADWYTELMTDFRASSQQTLPQPPGNFSINTQEDAGTRVAEEKRNTIPVMEASRESNGIGGVTLPPFQQLGQGSYPDNAFLPNPHTSNSRTASETSGSSHSNNNTLASGNTFEENRGTSYQNNNLYQTNGSFTSYQPQMYQQQQQYNTPGPQFQSMNMHSNNNNNFRGNGNMIYNFQKTQSPFNNMSNNNAWHNTNLNYNHPQHQHNIGPPGTQPSPYQTYNTNQYSNDNQSTNRNYPKPPKIMTLSDAKVTQQKVPAFTYRVNPEDFKDAEPLMVALRVQLSHESAQYLTENKVFENNVCPSNISQVLFEHHQEVLKRYIIIAFGGDSNLMSSFLLSPEETASGTEVNNEYLGAIDGLVMFRRLYYLNRPINTNAVRLKKLSEKFIQVKFKASKSHECSKELHMIRMEIKQIDEDHKYASLKAVRDRFVELFVEPTTFHNAMYTGTTTEIKANNIDNMSLEKLTTLMGVDECNSLIYPQQSMARSIHALNITQPNVTEYNTDLEQFDNNANARNQVNLLRKTQIHNKKYGGFLLTPENYEIYLSDIEPITTDWNKKKLMFKKAEEEAQRKIFKITDDYYTAEMKAQGKTPNLQEDKVTEEGNSMWTGEKKVKEKRDYRGTKKNKPQT